MSQHVFSEIYPTSTSVPQVIQTLHDIADGEIAIIDIDQPAIIFLGDGARYLVSRGGQVLAGGNHETFAALAIVAGRPLQERARRRKQDADQGRDDIDF